MYFIALATDYDGTLAHHGRADVQTIAALERLKASGRKCVAGSADATLHRAHGHVGVLGYYVVGQALKDRQQQRLALRGHKLAEGRDELNITKPLS